MTPHAPGLDSPVRPKLRVEGLSHEFDGADRRKILAISGIGLDVAPGSFVSLIGQSGCGKSTLFNIQQDGSMPEEAWAKTLSIITISGVINQDVTYKDVFDPEFL